MKNKYSIIALLACYVLMCYAAFVFYPKWQNASTEATLTWDANGYYAFLPAVFIYKDLKHMAFRDSIMQKYKPSESAYAEGNVDSVSNNYLLRYTCGQAVIMSPWFFIAHVFASNSSVYPADGYSFPYQICIGIGMFLFALFGLWFFRKVLLFYYADSVVAIVLIAIVFGTNYLNYASIDQAMTHSTLFTLYCLLVYNTILFYKNFSNKNVWAIGFCIGLITLVRPPDLICILIPALWGVSSFVDCRVRLSLVLSHWKNMLIIALCIGVVLSLQLAYGYFISGSIFYNGYKGFEFHFLHPHFWDFCFSPRAGWLLYCPMMILAGFGIFSFINQKQNTWVVIFFCSINFYIVAAWEVWWYGGRAMVQSYVLIAFILAAFISTINKYRIIQILFYPVFLFCIYINLWWTYQAHGGKVRITETSYAYYFATLGKWHTTPSCLKLIDNEDAFYVSQNSKNLLFTHSYKTDSTSVFTLNSQHAYAPEIVLPAFKKNIKALIVEASIECNQVEKEEWKMPQFFVKFYAKGIAIKGNMYRIGRESEALKKQTVTLNALLPKQAVDSVKIFFWNAGTNFDTKIYEVKCFVTQ